MQKWPFLAGLGIIAILASFVLTGPLFLLLSIGIATLTIVVGRAGLAYHAWYLARVRDSEAREKVGPAVFAPLVFSVASVFGCIALLGLEDFAKQFATPVDWVIAATLAMGPVGVVWQACWLLQVRDWEARDKVSAVALGFFLVNIMSLWASLLTCRFLGGSRLGRQQEVLGCLDENTKVLIFLENLALLLGACPLSFFGRRPLILPAWATSLSLCVWWLFAIFAGVNTHWG